MADVEVVWVCASDYRYVNEWAAKHPEVRTLAAMRLEELKVMRPGTRLVLLGDWTQGKTAAFKDEVWWLGHTALSRVERETL